MANKENFGRLFSVFFAYCWTHAYYDRTSKKFLLWKRGFAKVVHPPSALKQREGLNSALMQNIPLHCVCPIRATDNISHALDQ